jgi:hypothetical protein
VTAPASPPNRFVRETPTRHETQPERAAQNTTLHYTDASCVRATEPRAQCYEIYVVKEDASVQCTPPPPPEPEPEPEPEPPAPNFVAVGQLSFEEVALPSNGTGAKHPKAAVAQTPQTTVHT